MTDETYKEYYMRRLNQFVDKYKPEILSLGCVALGSSIISSIGLNVFNNRYISIPYTIFISILYVISRSQENAKRRISTN